MPSQERRLEAVRSVPCCDGQRVRRAAGERPRVNLSELYSTLWGDAQGARLVELALFCDTDDTGAKSTAYFSDIRVEARP